MIDWKRIKETGVIKEEELRESLIEWSEQEGRTESQKWCADKLLRHLDHHDEESFKLQYSYVTAQPFNCEIEWTPSVTPITQGCLYNLEGDNRSDYVKSMEEFHKAFDVPLADHPKLLDPISCVRRLTLITSEVGELGDSVRKKDIVEIADALGDLLYVTFGMALEMGLDIDRVFRDIHESNMTKVWPDGTVHKDAGGKVLKPESYKAVDLTWIKKQIEDYHNKPVTIQHPDGGYR